MPSPTALLPLMTRRALGAAAGATLLAPVILRPRPAAAQGRTAGGVPRIGGYPNTYANIPASNGYCHAIDGILLV
ncbi:MAG TPA: hypothetical protein VE684_17335 [Crenalkalicoccus sp.]|jgi:hypothetical protein|nr:hypothetical protein [Crenalkalicoccus sp.]